MNIKTIGICGYSGSGKSFYSNKLSQNSKNTFILSCDRYYKTVPKNIDCTKYNFDHPDAIDFKQLIDNINKLKQGKLVEIPYYDFKTHSRQEKTEHVKLNDGTTLILEGIFILCIDKLREILDIIVYIDTDEKLCFQRRLKRDIEERGRTKTSVVEQYLEFVKPSQDEFIKPYIKYADICIDNNNQSYKYTIPNELS